MALLCTVSMLFVIITCDTAIHNEAGIIFAGQLSLPSLRGIGKWKPASAGKEKAGMVHSVSGWTRSVQVKLWDPLTMRAVHEHLVHNEALYKSTFTLPYTLPFAGVRTCMSVCVSSAQKSENCWLETDVALCEYELQGRHLRLRGQRL